MLSAGLAAVRFLSIVTPDKDVQLVYPLEMFSTGLTLIQVVL